MRASILAGYDAARSARAERERSSRLPSRPIARKPSVPKARGGGRKGGKRVYEPLKIGQRFGALFLSAADALKARYGDPRR